MAGTWDSYDNATWRASAVFAAIWIAHIAVETAFRFKKTMLWYMVIASLLFNSVKIFVVTKYTELTHYGEPTGGYFDAASYVNVFVYLSLNLMMYGRKSHVCPDSNKVIWKDWDKIVLGTLLVTSVVGCLPCVLIDSLECWNYGSSIMAFNMVISLVYFDLYYAYKVVAMLFSSNKIGTVLELTLPALWSALCTMLYIIGTVLYIFGMANFYTNAYWNFTSVFLPIVVIQSCISVSLVRVLKSSKQISLGTEVGTTSAKQPVQTNHR